MIGRIPPKSTESEQAVLGGILIDGRGIDAVSDVLFKEHFYNPSHQMIYEGCIALAKDNEPIDLLTLKTKLENLGTLDKVGGIDYIAELSSKVPTSANIINYAKVIKDKFILREAIKVSGETIELAFSEPESIDNFIDGAEKRVYDLSANKTKKPFSLIQDLLDPTFEYIENLSSNNFNVSGIASGLGELDRITTGFGNHELVLIAARPAMGKTSLAMNIAVQSAVAYKKKVGIFSLEMGKKEVVARMLCSLARVDSQRYREGSLSDEEWKGLGEAADILNNCGIYIDDSADLNEISIKSKARRMKSKHGLDMVIVDYLQLMKSYDKVFSREQEIATISRAMKNLTKELGVPVVVLSQLNRELEKRTDKRPILSDLRESGSLEQDADKILFIYRDEQYNESSDPNEAEIIVAKHRGGKMGTAHVRYLPEFTLFDN